MGKTHRKSKDHAKYGNFENYHLSKNQILISMLRWSRMETEKEYRDWNKSHWDREGRDGGTYDSGNKVFKTLSKRHIRRAGRRAILQALDRDAWEDAIFPSDRDGKKFLDTVWW